MLRGKLTLHDVRDTEGLCARILERANLEQSHHEREDLLAFLIETAWELSVDFRAGEASFSTYLTAKLRKRIIDWQRQGGKRTRWQFSDRTYERQLPEFISTDVLDSGGLAAALGGQHPDPAVDSSADLLRVLGKRSSRAARTISTLGEAETRAAA